MNLKILTYNIQAGIGTQAYRQYLTQAGRQLFHTLKKTATLTSIARFTSDFDVACVQEVDLGGRRSNFLCQANILKGLSEFEYLSIQENRIVGNISRHGNAIFSKFPQSEIQDLKLPGKRTGRGAILAKINAPNTFQVLNVHLSLGPRDQMEQIEFLIENAPKSLPLIIAGDFNCSSISRPLKRLSEGLHLKILTTPSHKSYPSWKPRRDFDHMLVSPHFNIENVEIMDVSYSDHLPLSATLSH